MTQSNFELRRKLLQLEALYDVGRALNTLRPEGELLEELMQRAVATLDAMTGFIFSVDEKLHVQHLYTLGGETPSPSDGVVKQAMTLRSPVAANELLVAPMVAGDDVVGVLAVRGKEERAGKGSWSEDDVRFLSSLAAIGAAAVDNTRNFHRLDLM